MSIDSRLKPDVDRKCLYGIAGVFWSIAGMILLGWACSWLLAISLPAEVVFTVLGAGVASVAVHMFARIVKRNIERIEHGPARACAFSFQRWESYVMMFGMIAMGVILRHSAFPRPLLAIVYVSMGGALLGASILYHRRFVEALRAMPAG